MKRRLMIAFTVSALVLLGVYGAAMAQGPGGGLIDLNSLPNAGWYVAWQVQNVSANEASLSVEVKGAQGTAGTQHSKSVNIPAGSGTNFIPGFRNELSPPLPEGFIGSAVLSSDEPIVAIGFVNNTDEVPGLGIAGGKAKAAYQGVSGDDAGTRVNFPLVKNQWFGQSTTLYVQAAGQATQVQVTYRMNDGTVQSTSTISLDKDQMVVFTPSDVLGQNPTCGTDGANTPCVGGAVAESVDGKPIVGVYTEHPSDASKPAEFVMSTKGFSPNDAGTTLAIPLIKNSFFGFSTGVTVQNASSDSDVTINAEFRGAKASSGNASLCEGQTFTPSAVTVGPGESYVYSPFRDNMDSFPSGCRGSASITANGPIVATVNEEGGNKKTVYGAFAAQNATKKVAVPLVKEDWFGKTSGVAVQNVGEGDTTVTCTYNVVNAEGTNPGSVELDPQTINPGDSFVFYRVYRNTTQFGADAAMLEKSFSAVICESNSEDIVAIGQEEDLTGQFDLSNYEAFNIE